MVMRCQCDKLPSHQWRSTKILTNTWMSYIYLRRSSIFCFINSFENMTSKKDSTPVEFDSDLGVPADDMSEERSEIADFFEGRCVFITGATGFIGSVLLEKLLRCCSGIKYIYVLLRTRKGVDPATRKEHLFNQKIFQKLKDTCPKVFNKVIAVPGDLKEDNLGISEIMENEIVQNVTVVFHCAADVSFNKKLRYMILQNCIGTVNVVRISRKLQSCSAFIYTSSISICLKGFRKENLEKLPVPSKDILEVARSGDDHKLFEIAKKCNPPFQNTYIFSKAVCEDYLCREASDIPFLVVRPTYVINCWKGVCPGYMQPNSSSAVLPDLLNGTFQVGFCNPRVITDVVPADITTNTLITAAWFLNSQKPERNFVINNVLWNSPQNLSEFFNDGFRFAKEIAPEDKMFSKAYFELRDKYYTYLPCVLLRHYLPAIIIDVLQIIQGKTPKLLKKYLKYDIMLHYMKFAFLADGEFDFGRFSCNNFKILMKSQNKRDKELFLIDAGDFKLRDWYEAVHKLYSEEYFMDQETRKKEYIRLERLENARTAVKVLITACMLWFIKVLIDTLYSKVIIS